MIAHRRTDRLARQEARRLSITVADHHVAQGAAPGPGSLSTCHRPLRRPCADGAGDDPKMVPNCSVPPAAECPWLNVICPSGCPAESSLYLSRAGRVAQASDICRIAVARMGFWRPSDHRSVRPQPGRLLVCRIRGDARPPHGHPSGTGRAQQSRHRGPRSGRDGQIRSPLGRRRRSNRRHHRRTSCQRAGHRRAPPAP